MEHHDRGVDARGKFQRLERVFQGQLALARFGGGKLVKVRRCVGNTQRQRTEIMQAGNSDFTHVHGVQDAGHEGEPGAVAQFRVLKTQFTDLAQHGAAIGVPVGIPAGGQGIHGSKTLKR